MKSASEMSGEKATQLIKRAIGAALRDMLLDGRLDEPIRIQVKPNFDTACWSWQGGTHRVFVGDSALSRALPGLSRAALERYAGSYMHHERAHAMFTERDARALERWLVLYKVPFGLMNLVEDARVEHQYRDTSEDGFRFNWGRFELVDEAGPVAGCSDGEAFGWAFFRLIQAEGEPVDWSRARAAKAAVYADADATYTKAAHLPDTRSAVELAAEIVARYPELAGMRGRCGMEVGAALSGDAGKKAMEAFEQDAEDAGQPGSAKLPSGGPGTENGTGAQGDDLMGEPGSVAIDSQRVRVLAERLASLRGAAREVKHYDRRPGKRVSVRHAMQGNARWVRQKQAPGTNVIRNLLVVVDVSGSMDGGPLEAAAHLIAGLSACATAGELRGVVILSTTGDDGSRWLRKALPWTMEEASSLASHDGEGLADTLRDNDALLVEADETYVMTDGHIGGPRIPHESYKRRGLRVTGLYCNEDHDDLESVHEHMGVHFQRFVVRASVEALVEGMVLD